MAAVRALAAAAVLWLSAPAFSAAAPGSTAANFLNLDVGARPAAMAGTFAGLADGADAIAYNPAGLALLGRSEASFMHNRYLPGIRQEWFAASFPTKHDGTFAASINTLVVEPFPAYDVNDLPTGKVSAADGAYGLAYARGLGGGWSLGAGAQLISSRLDDRTATTAAYDVGAHWRAWRALELGLSALHLGGGLRYISATESLTRTIKFGAAFHPLVLLRQLPYIDRLSLLLDASLPSGQSIVVSEGLECSFGPLSVRAGERNGDYAGPGYTVGMGLALFRLEKNRPEIDFDYAFVDYGDLGAAHRAGLTVKFGASLNEKDGNRAKPGWKKKKVEPVYGPFFGPG